MNQEGKIKKFYNEYGEKEWKRLDNSPYDRLNYLLHMDFVTPFLKADTYVLDAGCGGGRYSVVFANAVAKIDLLDISEEQIRIAQEQMIKHKQEKKQNKSIVCSISNMNEIADETYDLTVCYGAPLNYLWDNYQEGINELYRVTKKGGHVVVSVNSRLGVFRFLFGNEGFDIADFMSKPKYWHIDQVIATGDLPEHPEVSHPSRHFFQGSELRNCFMKAGFTDIEMASSPAVISGMRGTTDKIYQDKNGFETLIQLELGAYQNEYLIDSGEFLLLRCLK